MTTEAAMLELKCRNCGSQLAPEDISPQLAAARCRHCHALFALPATVLKPAAALPRPEISLPRGYRMDHAAGGVQITRRWLTPATWFLLFFAIIWNGFMVGWNTIAFTQGLWFMSAFSILHVAVGVGIAYLVAAQFLNTTTIRCDRGTLTIHHGPLPWRGNQSLSTHEVRQLYCTEKITHGKNGSSSAYALHAVLANQQRKTLLKGLGEADQAVFIEQQIEKHLRLVDQPVDGEYGR